MSDESYHVPVRVHWADTDAAGIVWFGTFFRFFEEAEDELFRALGHARVDVIRDFNIYMPRVEATCRFRSPVGASALLDIGIAVGEVSERRILYRFEARERESRRLIAEGSYRVACVTRDTFTAVEFPPAVRHLLAGAGELARRQREREIVPGGL